MNCSNSEKQQSPVLTNALNKMIKTVKNSSGQTRARFLQKARMQFGLRDEEKYVITKLRLILVRLGADIDKLQIRKTARKGPQAKAKAVTRKEASMVEKETVMEKAQRIRAMKDFNMNNMKIKGSKSLSEFSKKAQTQETKTKKRRQSLEERQLAKLRSNKLEEFEFTTNESGLFQTSKLEFLSSFGLVPNVVLL